jgi:hypothetical protein
MLPSKYADCTRYIEFLASCRSKTYPEDTQTNWHHIQPRYDGGPDEDWNLIELSLIDHWEAHKILLDEFDHWADGWACNEIYRKMLGCLPSGASQTLSELQTKRFSDPEQRKKVSINNKKRFQDSNERRKISESQTKAWKQRLEKELESYPGKEKICRICKIAKMFVDFYPSGNKCKQCCKESDRLRNVRKKAIRQENAKMAAVQRNLRYTHQLSQFPGKEKICSACKLGKMYVDFRKRKASLDGRDFVCKECQSRK